MASKTSKTYKIGRSAVTGRFKTVKAAEHDKNRSVVETMKKPTGKKKGS